MRFNAYIGVTVLICIMLFVSAASPGAQYYDGTVIVRGNEPFTYLVLVTSYGEFEITGPLITEIYSRYQQHVIRILGKEVEQLSRNTYDIPALFVQKVVGVKN